MLPFLSGMFTVRQITTKWNHRNHWQYVNRQSDMSLSTDQSWRKSARFSSPDIIRVLSNYTFSAYYQLDLTILKVARLCFLPNSILNTLLGKTSYLTYLNLFTCICSCTIALISSMKDFRCLCLIYVLFGIKKSQVLYNVSGKKEQQLQYITPGTI